MKTTANTVYFAASSIASRRSFDMLISKGERSQDFQMRDISDVPYTMTLSCRPTVAECEAHFLAAVAAR